MKRPPIPPVSPSPNTSSLLTPWTHSSANHASEEKVPLLDKLDRFIDSTGETGSNGPSWKHRRRLIYGAYFLGVLMIVFGMITFLFDTQTGVEAIVGGVALISIIVSAYTGFSAWEDTRTYSKEPMHGDYGDNPE